MRLSRAWAGLAIALVLSVLSAPAVQAHAAYESSDPDNGATVSSPPSRVTADFTERLENGSLQVYDPCGSRVDNGDSLVAGDRLTVSMSAEKQGAYRVHFAVVSAVDGHSTSGDFGFTSSGGAPCPGAEPPDEDPGGGGSGGERDEGAAGRDQGSTGTSTATTSRRTGGDDRSQQVTRSASSKRSREKGNAGPRRDRRSDVATGRSEGSTEDESQALAAMSLSDAMNVWEGIPVSGFVVAMLIAAAIGAAGGVIYAGIVGPKR